MPTILVIRPGNVICLTRTNHSSAKCSSLTESFHLSQGPNSSNISYKHSKEWNKPLLLQMYPDPDLSSFSIRLTWLTSPEASNLSRRPDCGVAELTNGANHEASDPTSSHCSLSIRLTWVFTSPEASHLPMPTQVKWRRSDIRPRPFRWSQRRPRRRPWFFLKLMQKYSFNLQQLIDLLRAIVDGLMSFVSSIVASWLIMLQKINWTSAFNFSS